ncbi:MAG: TonB-dependent receptor [Gammaproteobacteria bacterium]|nr:TonB-dependent receptor [Gammaproteobacteria bacterium]
MANIVGQQSKARIGSAVAEALRIPRATSGAAASAGCSSALLAILAVGLQGAGMEAHAQTGARAHTMIDEIIVTTRRREELLSDLPLSVSVLTGDELEMRGVQDLFDLARQTPGLDFETTGSITGSRPLIRGINQQTRVGDEVNVATFVDGVYTPGFSGTTSIGFEGLERVEVAKGPQSALQGRNSFAGSISYITKRPGDEFEAGGSIRAAERGKWDASAFVSGPVIDGLLNMRLDGGYLDSGGTYRNILNNERLNNMESWFLRLNSVLKPTDNFTAFLSLSYQDDSMTPVAFSRVAPDDPQMVGQPASFSPAERGESRLAGLCPTGFGAAPICGFPRLYEGEITFQGGPFFANPHATAGTREAWRAVLDLRWDLGSVAVESLTGYQKRDAQAFSSSDPFPEGNRFSMLVGGGPGVQLLSGGPVLARSLTGSDESRWEISQDLRVQSDHDGAVNWLIGTYFSHEDFDDNRARCSDPVIQSATIIYTPPCPPQVSQVINRENTFTSIYGAIDVDVTERLSLSAELRWTSEQKKMNESELIYPIRTPPDEPFGEISRTFDFWTPRFVVAFAVNDDVMLYANAARGAKSGGFNSGVLCESPGNPSDECSRIERSYDLETNWTYEVGTKLSLFEGMTQLNLSAFYVDWSNQQVTTGTELLTESTAITANIGQSTVRGLEIEGRIQPVEWASINFGYALADTKWGSGSRATAVANIRYCDGTGLECFDPDGDGPALPRTTGNITGNEFQNVSKHSANLGLEVTFPVLGSAFQGFGRTDALYRSKRWDDEANVGFIGVQTTVNARLGVRRDGLTVQAFCNNLTDDRTPIRSFLLRNLLGVPHRVIIEREGRTCGLQMSMRY